MQSTSAVIEPEATTPTMHATPAPTKRSHKKREPATRTPAPAAAPETFSVSLTLDPATYDYFKAAADEDDRTLAKFIVRYLRAGVQAEVAAALAEQEVEKEEEEF